jgi:hypothetical protein
MFEQATQVSEAIRQSMGCKEAALIPALCGCVTCGAVQTIAAPVLGTCISCDRDLTTAVSSEVYRVTVDRRQQLLVA